MSIILFFFLFLSLPFFSSALVSSAISASQTLKLHGGYFLTAASLSSSSLYNITGTLLAPPDFAFSSFRPPPVSLLLSHTLKSRLVYQSDKPEHQHPTFQPNHCLTLTSVKFIHPNIYVDDNFIVHGIDRVLNSFPYCSTNPTETLNTAETKSRFLDHAARVLRRKGYGVVAAALEAKKPDLLSLDDVTVFAISDKSLFSEAGGFRYDFFRNVVPRRYRLEEIRRLTGIDTLSVGKTVTVGDKDGFSEIYRNGWIVVIGMSGSFGFSDNAVVEDRESLSPGVYGEEDTIQEWRQAKPRCTGEDYRFCEVSGGSEPLVGEKMVESAPSHEMNKMGKSEALDGRVLEESTVEMGRRKMSSISEELSGVGKNSEAKKTVQFQVADDLFYYT